MGPDAVIFSALALAGQYVWKLFWPAKLCAFYAFHMSTSPSDPRVVGGAVALTALAFLFVFFWNRVRLVSFALLFFFLNLAPVLNAPWMAANVFTERYLYLPSVGFCWVLGWAATTLWRAPTKHSAGWRVIMVLSVLVIATLCTLRIMRRNRDWHDDETLYKATLALQPDAYIIHVNLAAIYLDRDDFKNAEQELREADRVAPEYPLILDNFGLLNLKLKRYDDALHPEESERASTSPVPGTSVRTNRTCRLRREGIPHGDQSFPSQPACPCGTWRILFRPGEAPGGRETIPRIPPGGQDAEWLLGAGVGVLA
jgi:hypothetical protein